MFKLEIAKNTKGNTCAIRLKISHSRKFAGFEVLFQIDKSEMNPFLLV